MAKIFLLFTSFFFLGCTNSSLKPFSNAKAENYSGEAIVLIAVEGTKERKVRHIEIMTEEEPEGYVVYFHENKIEKGFIAVTLPTPSTNVRLSEYSLTGMYGCSRGKDGYGSGDKVLPKIENDKSYFLGTIYTSMNSMYKEMPKAYYKKAQEKYNYTPHGTDLKETSTFSSKLKL